MGATARFVHLCLANVAGALALLKELQDMFGARHNFFSQARNMNACFAALMNLELSAFVCQQIIDLLIVQLQMEPP